MCAPVDVLLEPGRGLGWIGALGVRVRGARSPEELYAPGTARVEEYGRHTGHADLLREAVDGLVGEAPPAGWRPAGATRG
ncbi:hypothetical protein [Geodermatophilus sp. SYSU D00710]